MLIVPDQPPRAALQVTVPRRAALSWSYWDTTRDTYRPGYVNLSDWRVRADACASVGGTDSTGAPAALTSFRFRFERLDGPADLVTRTTSACRLMLGLPALGRWRVQVTITTAAGRSAGAEGEARDLLVRRARRLDDLRRGKSRHRPEARARRREGRRCPAGRLEGSPVRPLGRLLGGPPRPLARERLDERHLPRLRLLGKRASTTSSTVATRGRIRNAETTRYRRSQSPPAGHRRPQVGEDADGGRRPDDRRHQRSRLRRRVDLLREELRRRLHEAGQRGADREGPPGTAAALPGAGRRDCSECEGHGRAHLRPRVSDAAVHRQQRSAHPLRPSSSTTSRSTRRSGSCGGATT